MLHEERKSTIFDLGPDPLVIEDEPSLLVDCLEKYREAACKNRLTKLTIRWPSRPALTSSTTKNGCMRTTALPRLAIEHLDVAREGSTSDRTLHTQPTTRYHGDVAAFVAEVRGRIAAGEHVLVSAASTGELERFADICHEFELPYRMGELEENTTVTRLAEEGSGAAGPSMVLIKAPIEDGVVFVDAKLGSVWQRRPFRDCRAILAATLALASKNSQLLQRFLGSKARRLCGAHRSRHRPIRRPAPGGSRRRDGRIHAVALRG